MASSDLLPRLRQKEERRRERAEWRSDEVKEEVVMPASCIRKETWPSREPLAVLPANC